MKTINNIFVRIALPCDYRFAGKIAGAINESGKKRGVIMPPRSKGYILDKMKKNLAVVAVHGESGEWVGFSYLEVWEHKQYVANSGLIVRDEYRGTGIAREIKLEIFELCKVLFPDARMFSLTANPTVVRVNRELGFEMVSFGEMLTDEYFLTGATGQMDYVRMMLDREHHADHVAMIYHPVSKRKAEMLPDSPNEKYNYFIGDGATL